MNEFSKYVGLDVHKKTIAVAVATAGRGAPEYLGEIANTPAAVSTLLHELSPDGEVLGLCYEAGPTGYGMYRQIQATGHVCGRCPVMGIPTAISGSKLAHAGGAHPTCSAHRR